MMLTRMLAKMRRRPIIVHVYVDGTKITAHEVRRELIRAGRRNGNNTPAIGR